MAIRIPTIKILSKVTYDEEDTSTRRRDQDQQQSILLFQIYWVLINKMGVQQNIGLKSRGQLSTYCFRSPS